MDCTRVDAHQGHSAVETKEALDRARSLIEQAEARGEPADDPLLLFSILYGFWVTNFVAFKGEVVRELSAQFLSLAEKQNNSVALMIGHRLVAQSLLATGEISEARAHYDKALALYDPAAHQSLATRFGQDIAAAALGYRAQAMWLLGYPDVALADAQQALSKARAIDHPVTMMHAPSMVDLHFMPKLRGSRHGRRRALLSANQRNALFWKACGVTAQLCHGRNLRRGLFYAQRVSTALLNAAKEPPHNNILAIRVQRAPRSIPR